MAIKRFEDWESRLHYSLVAHAKRPFAWGRHDCALAVCNHTQAITGTDLAVELRGKYSTALGAAKAIQRVCSSVSSFVREETVPSPRPSNVPFHSAKKPGFFPWEHAAATEVGIRKEPVDGVYTLEHLAEKVAADHSMIEINPRFAHRGDVVLFDTPDGVALGTVHLNARQAVVVGPSGLRLLRIHFATKNSADPTAPIAPARRAWRVPY